MSFQFVNTSDSISGLSSQTPNIDLGGSDGSQDIKTVIGFDAALINNGNLNTIYGFEAARFSSEAYSNILIGYRAGYTTNGDRNTFIGNRCGLSNLNGEDNIYMGMQAAMKVQTDSANANLLVGNYTGYNINNLGRHNVMMGHSNTSEMLAPFTGDIENNVCVGALANVQGCNISMLGYKNRGLLSDGSIILGANNLVQSAPYSVIIGDNITNFGRGSVIVHPNSSSGSDYTNTSVDHVNFKNILMGNTIGMQNCVNYETMLLGDDVIMRSRGCSSCNFVRVSPSGVLLHSSDDPVSIESPDTNVKGDVTFNSNIMILSANGGDDFWLQYVNSNNELVFESKYGTTMTLVDEFRPELLNFTGKHRCHTFRGGVLERMGIPDAETERLFLGRIVVACGTYRDLDGNTSISIDEAIPEIDLSDRVRDKRVMGVIGGFVSADEDQMVPGAYNQSFRLGNMHMKRRIRPPPPPQGKFVDTQITDGGDCQADIYDGDDMERVIVQSLGEGAILVCDENGDIEIGDYITTSSVPGIGMRQDEGVLHNFTVAKATCVCHFHKKGTSLASSCLSSRYSITTEQHQQVDVALIGCLYCC